MPVLWILNHYASHPARALSQRHYALARHLLPRGWETHILAATYDHLAGVKVPGVWLKSVAEPVDGVYYHWLKTPSYRGNRLGRVVNIGTYTVQALMSRCLKGLPRPDLVMGTNAHLLAAYAGMRLAKRFRVPFLFEVRDLWPRTLEVLGLLPAGHPLTRALYKLERRLYLESAGVVAALPAQSLYFQDLELPPPRTVYIPNGVALNDFPPLPPPDGKTDFDIFYFGYISTQNALEILVDALKLVKGRVIPQPVRAHLYGFGPSIGALKAKISALGLDNVTVHPPVPKSSIPALAAQADAFYAGVLNRPELYRYGISYNKLGDYLAAGRPVLMSADVPGNPVLEAGCGWVVPPEDPAALADAICAAVQTPPDQRRRMGWQGRRYAETQRDWKVLADRLGDFLDDTLRRPTRSSLR